ncbi:hypothetical protein DCO16_01070 [Polynucleobacter antarcticus]|uniref:Uncharacterized protein n=1 Tax=Polynucleobacter antarcticus TaxID=1743162 RepID=A0A6M9PSM4_9BURK|nr:hypothetical protein DCO16_01070 [Polynucleobacter antarcticus]
MNFTCLQAEAYGRVPVGKGQAAAGFNVVEAAAFLATGFFTALPAFFAAGLLTFFLQLDAF